MVGQFVPADFEPPLSFEGKVFRMEPLGAVHNDRDYGAWMSSIEHIRSTPGFEKSDWPHPMSLQENLSDLVKHADDFECRTGFTYSILHGDEVIGCLYIYPPTSSPHDADVRSWVSESAADLDAVVWSTVTAWLSTAWPFRNPYYAPRPE
jgi:hypothetical protein